MRVNPIRTTRISPKRWLKAAAFWKSRPPRHCRWSDGANLEVRSGSPDLWFGFFLATLLLRHIAQKDDILVRLSPGITGRLLVGRKLAAANIQRGNATRLTGDEAPLVLSGASWGTLELPRFRPDEVSGFPNPPYQNAIIAECVVAPHLLCVVMWSILAIPTFYMMGSDNVNAIAL